MRIYLFLQNSVTSEGVVSHNVLYYQWLSNACYQVSFFELIFVLSYYQMCTFPLNPKAYKSAYKWCAQYRQIWKYKMSSDSQKHVHMSLMTLYKEMAQTPFCLKCYCYFFDLGQLSKIASLNSSLLSPSEVTSHTRQCIKNVCSAGNLFQVSITVLC